MSQWNLNDILDDAHEEMRRVESAITRVKKHLPSLSKDMTEEEFRRFIALDENVEKLLSKVISYAVLREAADLKDQQASAILSKAQNLHLRYHELSLSVRSWLQGLAGNLDEKNAKRLFKAVPEHSYTLRRTRKSVNHSLSEPEEKIAQQKDSDLLSTVTEVRRLITNEFTYFFKPKGYKRGRTIKTTEELMSHTHSPDGAKRRAAFDCLLTKHKEHLEPLYSAYRGVVRDWAATARRRGFKNPISMRNFSNNVADEAIDTLLDVCRKNRGIFHRYFKFKAKELGMKRLDRYDLYAPLSEKEEQIPFKRAKEIVLSTFKEVSRDFHDKAAALIEAGHIDAFPRENKQGGGFCLNVGPGVTPYILLNYTGKVQDVFTLAHELGHAIHNMYSSHLPPSVQDAPLPLAETASTFTELAVFDALYEREPGMRKDLLSQRVSDSYATIAVQCYFTLFEKEAHRRIPEGLTAEELCSIYQGLQDELFGKAVKNHEIFRYGWAYVPHFVEAPFYCYAYSFGQLLSMALYERYKTEGSRFIPTLQNILSAGGAYDPARVLKKAGFDMRRRESWEQGFRLIARWQRRLERL